MPSNETLTQALYRLTGERERGGLLNRAPSPQTLPIDKIAVCPKVFQPRVGSEEDGTSSPLFISELAGQLRNKPTDARHLDSLTVWAAGRKAYVVNGHHRLAAYKLAGSVGEVPVKFFDGTIYEAQRSAIEEGAKSQLNFDRRDRNEAAWRLVVMDKRGYASLTVNAIASLSGIRPRSVDRMRALYTNLSGTQNEFTGEPEFDDYADALASSRRRVESSNDDLEQWLEEQAEDWAARLGKAFGKQPHEKPSIFARALELYLGANGLKRVAEVLELVEIDGEQHEAFLAWQSDDRSQQ